MRGFGRFDLCAVILMLMFSGGISVQAATINFTTAPTLAEGDANIGFPFNTSYFTRNSMRYQQVFDVSSFGKIPMNGEIVGIAFRVDGLVGESFDATLQLQIDLSTVASGVRRLDATFSNNIGVDDKKVFEGKVRLASTARRDQNSKTMPFDVVIDFNTPFVYRGGNLLLDIRNFSGGRTSQLDGMFAPGNALTRVYSFDVNASQASVRDNSGLIAQFKVQTFNAPLPGPLGLMFAPLTWLVCRHRRRHEGRSQDSILAQ
ncbi:MAG: hypothetical protein U1F34_02205 [Gammaproteobacteria bacterium]